MAGLPAKMPRLSSYLSMSVAQLTIILTTVSQFSTLGYGTPLSEPSAEEIKAALIKHEIFQDLNITKYPKHFLQVNYEAHHLMLGTKIPEKLAIVPPNGINFTYYDDDTYYTLITVGLDNPSKENPEKRSYKHWVIGNIPENQFSIAECLVPYDWKNAPYTKGLHRVAFILFKQPDENSMVFDERYLMRSKIELPRSYFNTTYFTVKYELGDPVAVNFFTTDIEEDHNPPIKRF